MTREGHVGPVDTGKDKIGLLRRRALAVAALAAMALIALNLLGEARERRLAGLRQPVGELPRPVRLAAPFGSRWVAVSGQTDLRLMEGASVVASRSTAAAVTALAASERDGRIYTADVEGRVDVYDSDMSHLARVDMPGQVFALAALDGGGIAACYGFRGYGPDHFVRVLDRSLEPVSPEDPATGFSTNLLVADGAHVYFATGNSRLGRVDGGRLVWKRVLQQRPLAVAAAAGLVAVGDRRGFLTLVDGDGEIVARAEASRFPLARVAFSRNGAYVLTADKSGHLSIYDRSARQLCRLPSGDGRRIAALLPAGGDMIALSSSLRSAALERVPLSSVTGLRRAADFRIMRTVANVALAGLLLTGALLSDRRLSGPLSGLYRRLRANRTAYALLTPSFALLFVFSYYPVVTAFVYSLTTFSLSSPIEFSGLANFRQMWDDPYVWVGVKNMFLFLVTGLIKTLTVPLLVAELVYWLAGNRLQQVFRTAFVVPAIVPGLVGILLWKMIYEPRSGLLNKTLEALGLDSLTHAWLAEESLAIWAIIFAGFPWVNVFAFLILLGGLVNISRQVFEAAELDGIGPLGRFFHIDLPLLAPQIKLLIVFVFIGSIQDFTNVLVFTGGGPGNATYVPALQMFMQTAEGANLGYASAVGVVLFAFVFGATVLNLKLIREREGY